MLTATALAIASLAIWCAIAAVGLFACVTLACDAVTAVRQAHRIRAELAVLDRRAEGGRP